MRADEGDTILRTVLAAWAGIAGLVASFIGALWLSLRGGKRRRAEADPHSWGITEFKRRHK